MATLVLLGTARCLHFEMRYEVNGTKLHDINKKCAAAAMEFRDEIGTGAFYTSLFLHAQRWIKTAKCCNSGQLARPLALIHTYVSMMLLIMTLNPL